MRIWSIHPKYLDKLGLIACWRETLLAKHVLLGLTNGYKNHPQLFRFKNTNSPINYINAYLKEIYNEATNRGYNFDINKIGEIKNDLKKIEITSGQIKYEFEHLLKKLKIRDVEKYNRIKNTKRIESVSLFKIIAGEIEPWEKI